MSDIDYTYIITDNDTNDSEDAVLVIDDYYDKNSICEIEIPIVGIPVPDYTIVKDKKEDILVYAL